MNTWTYLKSGLTGEQVGPISNADFLNAVQSGVIKPKTKVHHTELTSGNWVEAMSVPKVAAEFSKLKQAKDQEKSNKRAERETEKRQNKQEKAQQIKDKQTVTAHNVREQAVARAKLVGSSSVQGETLVEIRNLLIKIHANVLAIGIVALVMFAVIVLSFVLGFVG